MTESPSGTQVTLRHGAQTATVVTCGGGLREYSIDATPIIDGYAADAVCSVGRGQILAPWPNRVRDGAYAFAGETHQLDLSEPARGHAIHGLVRWVTWTVADHDAASARLEYALWASHSFPFVLHMTVMYVLGDGGLTVTLTARNVGSRPAPWGVGFHPYILTSGAILDDAELTAPVAARLVCDDRLIPVGRESVVGTDQDFRSRRRIGSTGFDTCFAGLERDADGIGRITVADGNRSTTVWMDSTLDYVMLFSGDGFDSRSRRRSLAIEPMTCAPNAFQSGDGLIEITPGGAHVSRWGISSLLLRP